MRLDKKLDAWQRAERIDAQTAERIRAFEGRETRLILLWAMGGVGALAVALGLVSVVAANWASLSATLELAVALAIGCVLVASIDRVLDFEEREPGTEETEWKEH